MRELLSNHTAIVESIACHTANSDRGLCSYHGYCCDLPDRGCVCDNGWTGLGDFSLVDGEHCDINRVANRVVFFVIIVQTVICLTLVVRYLVDRLQAQGWTFRIAYDPKTLFPWFLLSAMIFQLMFAICKLVDEDQIVGRDLYITVLATLLPSTAQGGVVLYTFVIIKCLSSYAHVIEKDSDLRLTRFLGRVASLCGWIPFLSLIFSIMPIVGIWRQEHEKTFALIYLIGNGGLSWAHGIFTCIAILKLVHELNKHATSFPQASDDMRLVIRRLNHANYAIGGTTLTIGTSYIAFGISDYLFRKSSYLFMYQLSTCAPASTFLILTVSKLTPTFLFHTRVLSRRASNLTAIILKLNLPSKPQQIHPGDPDV